MPHEASLRHLMTLCHEADCCPEIYHDELADGDCCVVIKDDYGNTAYFSPVDLPCLIPIRVNNQICLRDTFGREVYMLPAQYDLLFLAGNRSLLAEVAQQRGLMPAGDNLF